MRKFGYQSSNGSDAPLKLLPAPAAPVQSSNRQALSPALCLILEEVQRELGFNACLETEQSSRRSAGEVEALVLSTAARLGFDLTAFEKDEIIAQLEFEQKPFGILQELVDNPKVSDIIITNHARIAVQIGRKNYPTNIRFPSLENFEVFVERLLQKAGTTYSTRKPIADGMIGSFARIHAVHSSLCESGPYVTIRLNRLSTVTLEQLHALGLAPQEVLAYLKGMIRAGRTALIAGEVGTGKTTLARALAASVPAEESILVIEDTPEIRLEHPHVRYVTTREANADGAGRVTPCECIRAGMRMAMNRIIFGEMRDAEAAEAFVDVCASGHPGLSTIHARSAAEAAARLELFLGRAQKGVGRGVLQEEIANAVQVVVYIDICRVTGVRRIIEVREIGPLADGVMRTREMFRYQPDQNGPCWRVAGKVSAHREALEALDEPVALSALPPLLRLER